MHVRDQRAKITRCVTVSVPDSIQTMRTAFVSAIRSNQSVFDLDLPDDVIERLADYYEFIQEHNPILHLVAPGSPAEFATRHILESMTLLKHLPDRARFVDVGTGAGLPAIPCLIAREDLRAILIESKEKKTSFLRDAVDACGIAGRTEIVNRQFNETTAANAQYVTCRALDKFVEKLPQLLKWSGKRRLLLFGGPSLMTALDKAGRQYTAELMPLSEQRFLFDISIS